MAKIYNVQEFEVRGFKTKLYVEKAIAQRYPDAELVDIKKDGKNFIVRILRDVGKITPAPEQT